jgi:hypothetical protein
MGLRDVFAEALPDMFNSAGEAAVFTPEVGDPIDCMVFIDFNVMLQPSGVEVQVWQRGTTIEALLSEIGREPNRGETFTVDSVDYTVQAILENDGLTVKAVVT